ncbi:STAS domain-containing protein [Pseudonocardia humida]|uniref:STAS domain-containing protein n=1 Tax=Pseudonocardia humida TaxID=2800819 RepID=A0ABT1A748_9PSEU|nr:STAS domain-containing protein [Pseudonocardia humida]MCO1658846.1 STAS domain-containing protein [Pseudonocardia humida]
MDQWHLMQLAVDSSQGAPVVHVVGELTAVSAPRLLRLCEGVLARSAAGSLTVDLSGVRHFEPEGVAVLLRVRDRCAAAGSALVLGGVSDRRGALPLRVEQVLDEVDDPTTADAGPVLA